MEHLYNNEDRRRRVFIGSDGKHLGTWKADGGVGNLSGGTAAQSPLRGCRKGACFVLQELEEAQSLDMWGRKQPTLSCTDRAWLSLSLGASYGKSGVRHQRTPKSCSSRELNREVMRGRVPEYNPGHLSSWTSVCLPRVHPSSLEALTTIRQQLSLFPYM